MGYCERCGEDHETRVWCRHCLSEMCGDCMTEQEFQSGLCRVCLAYPGNGSNTMLSRTMPDLREAVLSELGRRGWSHYQLVQALKGKRPGGKDVPPVTVYEFLRGETSINSNDLGLIFDALALKVKR